MQQPIDQSVGQRKDVPGQYVDIALIPGQYLDIALVAGQYKMQCLQWPLIRPRKVLHYLINRFSLIYLLYIKLIYQ